MNESGLTLIGKVEEVYKTFERVSKSTGEQYGGDWRIQIETVEQMAEGQRKVDFDLRTDDPAPFQSLKGKMVRLAIQCWSPAKGQIVYTPIGKPVPFSAS